MVKKFRSFYLFVSTLVITLLHLPFAFAKSATGNMFFNPPPSDSVTNTVVETPSMIPALKSVYDSLALNLKGLSQQAFDYAKEGFQCKHNLKYWEFGNYIGFGPSSHSMVNGVRWNNFRDI